MLGLTSLHRRRSGSATPGRELSEEQRRVLPQAFEAVGEALVAGVSPLAACAVAGRTLAHDGASLGEALTGLRFTYAALGGAGCDPDFEAVMALCEAWGESTLDFLHDLSCEDPLTGLATLAHLRTRIAEVYREADRSGEPVRTSHALVVVDTAGGPDQDVYDASFARALRLAGVSDALRTVFSGEETIARVGADKVVVLARRSPELAELVGIMRELFDDLRVAEGARIWIEGLPSNPDLGVRLLSELARA